MREYMRMLKVWCFCALLILLVTWAASDAADFAGGTGEPNDPYQIATAEQLILIGSDPNLLDKHFVLVNHIDLDPNLPGRHVFTRAVIAGQVDATSQFLGAAFTGCFDGSSYRIRNLTINSNGANSLGLFGYIGRDGRVYDLDLENALIIGGSEIGGLAGYNLGSVTHCKASVSVSGDWSVGGLV